jgi:hypothetical protein
MRKILWLLLLFPLPLLAQVSAPSIILAGSAPSGTCTNNLPDRQVATAGKLYSCQSGTWAPVGSGAGVLFQNLGALTVTSNAATLATAGYYFTAASVALSHTSTTTVTLNGISSPGANVALYATQDSTGSNTITLAGCPTGNFLVSTGAGLVSSTTPALTAPLSGANNIVISYTGANCMVVVQ